MKRSILDGRVCGFILDACRVMKVTCVGTSMEPTIMNRQSVEIGEVTTLRPGHTYLFRYRGELVVHRLATRRRAVVFFLGDNSRIIEQATIEAVLGKVADAHSWIFRAGMALMNYFFCMLFASRGSIPVCCQQVRRACIRMLLLVDSVFSHGHAGFPVCNLQPGVKR